MFKTTVDSIVSDVTNKVTQLRKISEEKCAEGDLITDEIEILEKKREETYAEAERAARLALNFEELVS